MKKKIKRNIGLIIILFIALSLSIFLLKILVYGFFSGMLIWSIIVVIHILNMVIVVSAIILLILFKFNLGQWDHETNTNNTKTNNKDVDPFSIIIDRRLHKLTLVIFLIIIFSILIYSFFSGMLIWGIIAIIQILILIALLYGIIWFWGYLKNKKS
ncbi:MAG: hypothetical protein K8R25_11460 [Methanosarcinales archaeon]|nr:hypothetical protein [Methanosarcinales archaeon]